jgi:hypothetical protein
MEIIISIMVAFVAGLVATTVGYISNQILKRQKDTAKEVQQLAGIESIELVEEKQPFISLAQVLITHKPDRNLRILAVSGASALYQNQDTLVDLLARGVQVQIMLLDPTSDNWLFKPSHGRFD